jgi:hypothetical protein
MPLNLGRRRNSGDDDFVAALRYAARTNTWSTWDTDSGGMIDLPEIIATFDLQHIHTGFMKFTQGEPPDFIWDVDGKAQQRPSKDHKRGFSVHLHIDGFGLRELCSNSGGSCEAINVVFDQYERDPHASQGLLPVIQTGAATKADSPFGSILRDRRLGAAAAGPADTETGCTTTRRSGRPRYRARPA